MERIVSNHEIEQIEHEDWLVQNDSPEIDGWLAAWDDRREDTKRVGWWKADYDLLMRDLGYASLDEAIRGAEANTAFGAIDSKFLNKLSKRETANLAHAFLTVQGMSDNKLCSWDLYQSAHRRPHQIDRCSAILPSSLIWLYCPKLLASVCLKYLLWHRLKAPPMFRFEPRTSPE